MHLLALPRQRHLVHNFSFREFALADIQHPAWLCAVVVVIVIADHDRGSIVRSTTSAGRSLITLLTWACAISQRGAHSYSPVCRRGPGTVPPGTTRGRGC